jgi:hypothetical protein
LDITVATRVFFLELALFEQVLGADGHDVVAVDNLALFIADDEPVAVAVEGQADVGPFPSDRLGHQLRVQRAALAVDVGAVRVTESAVTLAPSSSKTCGATP